MSALTDPSPNFTVNPQTPTRQLRHQSSLEHIFQFTLSSPQPTRADRDEAFFLYNQILDDCQTAGLHLDTGKIDRDGNHATVQLHNLFRALVEFSPKDVGRLNIVRLVLHGLFLSSKTTPEDRSLTAILPLVRTWLRASEDQRQPIYRMLEMIARDFVLGFFVPLTAQASCTPHISGLLSSQDRFGAASTQGTPHRLSDLREACLLRDGHRCVVSGHLDKAEHMLKRRRGRHQPGTFGVSTQAAHIIPHSLNSVKSSGDRLSDTKSFVWQILNMFDTGVSAELEGSRIDTPANAMIMATELHEEFGLLRCYFEELAPNTYAFRRTRDAAFLSPAADPKAEQITFLNHEPEGTGWADLPSARLLKLHAACCKMMEMAGAAEYVELVMRDLEGLEREGTLAGDGSTDIGMVLRMKGLWSGFGTEDEEEEPGKGWNAIVIPGLVHV